MTPTNSEIARRLREVASELARGGDNLYRVRAFRQAAMTVLGLPEELSAIVTADGPRGLERLPGIGKSLAETIAGYLRCVGETSGVAA
jgi:DNA polymerase (family 10)